MDILIFIDTFIKLLNQYDFFKGIYFLHKRNEMKIQFWCNQDYDTSFFSTLKDKINTFFKKMIKPLEFLLFFPPPLSDAPDLSIIKMRNKKVYLLRFGTIMTNFFYVKKIWWEVELFDYFKKYYIPHTNMIDIGANVGTHSLLMSEIISNDSMIYAFEPVYWDVTMKNIYENNLQNKICLFTQGLGNSNKIIEVPVMDRMKPENFGRMSLIKDVTQKSKIKKKIGVITLDSLNLTNISVIKIDVEGMEREVLEGGKKTISENLPAIIIEIWPEEMDSFVNSDIGKYLLNECKYEIVPILTTGSNHDYILVSKNKKYINPGNL